MISLLQAYLLEILSILGLSAKLTAITFLKGFSQIEKQKSC